MQYVPGTKVTCTIINVLPSGVLARLPDNSTEWIRKRDLLLFHDVRPLTSLLNIGDKIEALVIREKPENKKDKPIRLSPKAALDSPWTSLREKTRKGSLIEGMVTKLYSTGAFVLLLNEGIEGFVKTSEIATNISRPEEAIFPGDNILCTIKSVDIRNQKIELSIKNAISKDTGDTLKNANWSVLTQAYNEASLRYIQDRFGKLNTEKHQLLNASREIVVEKKYRAYLLWMMIKL